MAEYIEQESAEAIFRNARRRMKPEMYKTFDEFNTRDCMLLNAEQLIHLLPAADVAEVVRCKDCKYAEIASMGHLSVCKHPKGMIDPNPNSFCSYGERRVTMADVRITRITHDDTDIPLCRRDSDGAVGCYDVDNDRFVEFTCDTCRHGTHWDGVVICGKDGQRHERNARCNYDG